MLIVADARLPVDAKNSLRRIGDLLEFRTEGITYEAISGHPDIFLFQSGSRLVVAPNTPAYVTDHLRKAGVKFINGRNPVGCRYPETAGYNAVFSGQKFIHLHSATDPAILEIVETIPGRELVNVPQGYTRCNLLALDEVSYITSDRGIYSELYSRGLDVLFVSPESILLPGFRHGFIGGCCGILDKTVYLTGSLSRHPDGQKARDFIESKGFSIVELYSGPLFDGGGIFFL